MKLKIISILMAFLVIAIVLGYTYRIWNLLNEREFVSLSVANNIVRKIPILNDLRFRTSRNGCNHFYLEHCISFSIEESVRKNEVAFNELIDYFSGPCKLEGDLTSYGRNSLNDDVVAKIKKFIQSPNSKEKEIGSELHSQLVQSKFFECSNKFRKTSRKIVLNILAVDSAKQSVHLLPSGGVRTSMNEEAILFRLTWEK